MILQMIPGKSTYSKGLLVVPVGGLEPPRLAATDFESVVYTNFTTPAQEGISGGAASAEARFGDRGIIATGRESSMFSLTCASIGCKLRASSGTSYL